MVGYMADIWYFETSAINHMLDGRDTKDALATRILQLNKGRDWRISPTCLWEILTTQNEQKKEQILGFSQNLFSRDILPSVSEIIVGFVRQGMPIYEPMRTLTSRGLLAETWRDLVDDRSKTFVYDKEELRYRIKMIQELTKKAHGITRGNNKVLSGLDDVAGLDAMLNSMVNQLPFVMDGEPLTIEDRYTYKLSIFFIMHLFCAELEMENHPIQEYWREIGIDSTQDRIVYVIKHLTGLVHRGPFVLMALMAKAQSTSKGKYPRGVWFDCMHSVYLSYVDAFFTTDAHFTSLRNDVPHPVLAQRLQRADQIPWQTVEIDIAENLRI